MSVVSYAELNSLEKFALIAGNSYTLEFVAYQEDGVSALDLGGATIKWVLSPYGQTDFTSLQLNGTITGLNTFKVELSNVNTRTLSGTYIQQPVITAFSGKEYRPAQGVVVVLPGITVS